MDMFASINNEQKNRVSLYHGNGKSPSIIPIFIYYNIHLYLLFLGSFAQKCRMYKSHHA